MTHQENVELLHDLAANCKSMFEEWDDLHYAFVLIKGDVKTIAAVSHMSNCNELEKILASNILLSQVLVSANIEIRNQQNG